MDQKKPKKLDPQRTDWMDATQHVKQDGCKKTAKRLSENYPLANVNIKQTHRPCGAHKQSDARRTLSITHIRLPGLPSTATLLISQRINGPGKEHRGDVIIPALSSP